MDNESKEVPREKMARVIEAGVEFFTRVGELEKVEKENLPRPLKIKTENAVRAAERELEDALREYPMSALSTVINRLDQIWSDVEKKGAGYPTWKYVAERLKKSRPDLNIFKI